MSEERNTDRVPDSPSRDVVPWRKAADQAAEEKKADVLFLNGPIDDQNSFTVIDVCEHRNRLENVILILVTEGGNADAAYRISRCLQALYNQFIFFVSGYCKSAGTLVSLGADEIVITDRGELGPLDVQLRQEDELFQTRSGLTVLSALSTLNECAFEAYEHFLLQLKVRSRGGITTKTATQTAADMAGELFGRVYEHIDPMHVGEAGRSLRIAYQYGQILQRKGNNCKERALDRLTTQYPSHGFIIDRFQAENLFHRVGAPSPSQKSLVEELGIEALRPRTQQDQTLLTFLNTEKLGEQNDQQDLREESVPARTKPNDETDSDENRSSVGGDSPGRLVEVSETAV